MNRKAPVQHVDFTNDAYIKMPRTEFDDALQIDQFGQGGSGHGQGSFMSLKDTSVRIFSSSRVQYSCGTDYTCNKSLTPQWDSGCLRDLTAMLLEPAMLKIIRKTITHPSLAIGSTLLWGVIELVALQRSARIARGQSRLLAAERSQARR